MRIIVAKFLPLLLLFFLSSSANAQQWGKYTLYATMNGTTAKLIDTNNVLYHTWTFPTNKKTGYSTYLEPDRILWRTVAKGGNSFTGGPICGEVQKVAWDGTVLWDYIYSTTTYCTHHDIHPMPNGNVLLISYELKSAAEATQAGSSSAITMWPDKIVEVEPVGASGGNIVWEWHAWDHLVQDFDNTKDNYQTSIVNHPELLNINYRTIKDWIHMNGVDYNDSLDQIAFSSHNLDEIYVIDHSTTTVEAAGHTGGNSGKGGDLLYRWGNPLAYQASGFATLDVVHDAHWVSRNCPECPNANYLVGFNNNGISNNQSSVDLVNPPYSGNSYSITPGSAFLPAAYTDRHSCTGHTTNTGGSQQMPNGNMMVTMGLSGNIYEVNATGSTVWSFTASGSVPKAWRYSECYVDSVAGTPTTSWDGTSLTSTAGVTYQWYMDSVLIPGATSQTFTPTLTGNYQVVITNSEGCTSGFSLPYSYNATDISELLNSLSISIFPNPSTGWVNISMSTNLKGFTVSVKDLSGRILVEERDVLSFDISNLNAGLYFLSISSKNSLIFTTKFTLLK